MKNQKFEPKRISTELASPIDAVLAIFAAMRALFGKQKENEMLKDLQVQKGFFSGVRYAIFIAFVLPFRLLAFVLSPSWIWVRFIERQILTPIIEFVSINGKGSPSVILGNVYEQYLHALTANKTNGVDKPVIKPEISSIDRILIYAKFRVLATLFLFVFVAWYLGTTLFDLGDMISFITATISTLFSPWNDAGRAAIAFVRGAVMYWGLILITGAFISYLFIFAIRFVLEMFTQLIYTDRKIMQDFIDDTIHYSVLKSMEIYGEETAMAAYELLMENYIMQGSRYQKNDPHYAKLPLSSKKSDER